MAAAAIERLISATKGRRADLLEAFLSTESGFDVKQRFEFGSGCFSAFHYAAGRRYRTYEDADDWLGYFCLKKAVPVDATDGFACCALHHACLWGNVISVEWLIRHDASVDQRNGIGRTPYFYACASSIDSIPKLKCLESHHADPLIRDSSGNTALHFTASFKYTSDEESHKILSYLVTEKGISVNAASKDGTTPLRAAFHGGSLSNVKWLLKHGAKKPGEEELCAAAQSQTSEHETDALLSCLIKEEGLSINSTLDDFGLTPLHFACEHGSFWAMKWLFENGANVDNEKDRPTMKTLVMRACDGGVDVFDKLLYLTDKGLDFKAKNVYKGQTALFFAASTIHKHYQTTLKYLVKEKGLPLNDTDQRGETPFLRACGSYSLPLSLLNFLIDMGADVTATNKRGENALHRLASRISLQSSLIELLIELLIEKGVDITKKDAMGMRPHEKANGENRMLLRRSYDAINFSVLGEKVQLDSCKLCVVGNEMAGKTTSVNSLLDLNRPPIDPNDRTAGVVVRADYIPGVGKGSIWDFGAQPTFHSAHGLFFGPSNTIFVLVLCYCKDGEIVPEAVLLRRGLYWLGFAKAARRPILSVEEARPHVVVLGNVIGKGDDNAEASFQLKRIVANLQKDKSKSNGMTACRAHLRELRQKVLKNAAGVPKLCRGIEENICVRRSERDDRLVCFMNAADFSSWIKERFRLTLTDDVMRVIFDYLDSSGIIIDLGRRKCLEPPLLCQNVIGPLLSPPYFPISVQANDAGIANKEDIASALEAFRNDLKQRRISSEFSATVDEAIEVLVYLQLYIPIENKPGVYQVPALIRRPKPDDAWSSEAEMNVYRGQRYQCTRLVDIISPSSFVILQFRCSQMTSICYEAWKDGMKLVKIVDDKAVECLIEFGVKEHCCIDVVLRWSNQFACEKLAEELLSELKTMIASVCDERSPGVPLDWCYLDSKNLERLDEDPAIYSASDVELGKDLNHVVISIMPKGRRHCRVRDLVVVVEEVGYQVPLAAASCTVSPSEDAFPANDEVASDDLLRACAAAAGSKWESIGGLLIDLDELDEIAESARDKKTRLLKVLKAWKNASRSPPTVGKLLQWFLEVDIAERVIKRKYIDLFG